jgi:hypothetical protein
MWFYNPGGALRRISYIQYLLPQSKHTTMLFNNNSEDSE